MKRRSPILDHRQRAFARAVAEGMPTARAQEVAGYKPNRKNANRLLRDERVLAEIARMRTVIELARR
jgi:phage terminase small subunit